MSRFHTLTTADVRRETPEAVSIAFAIPDRLREAYRFTPGQYLTLKTQINGTEARRSYSICSGLDDGEIRVAIKQVDGGVFSTYANTVLAPGMALEVMEPEGRFTAVPDATAARQYVAFASGSGVTPIMAIVKSVLAREAHSRFTLFYGNRNTGSIIFREQLEDLKDRFLNRFVLAHLLSREGQDVDLLSGRLEADRIGRLAAAGLFDPSATDAFFLCGPGDMIKSGQAALRGLGVAPEKIRFEVFTPANDGARTAPSRRARKVAAKGVAVEAVVDGIRRSFAMEDGDDSVVAAGQRNGHELPYSCLGGMCCTCRCKVIEGQVEMAANYSLQPWEIEAGFVLACQSRPVTDHLVLDFDAV